MKTIKLSFLSFIFLLSCTVANAQWIQKASLPAATRAMTATFAIGNKIYVCGGRDVNAGTIYQDVWEYDVLMNTWTKKANFGGGFRSGMVAFTIGNKGYVGMGTNISLYFNDLWEYDPALDSWTAKANFPGPNREEAAGFSIGNKGYAGTGQRFFSGNVAVVYDDFYEYNPVADAWTQKANFPGGVRTYAAGCSIGNKGYMGFGGDGAQSVSYDDLYEYDSATDTWITRRSLTGTFMADAGMVAIGTDLFFLGGINFSTFNLSNKCSRYNPLSNAWTAEIAFPGGVISGQGMVAVNGKMYAGTGFNQALDGRGDWWEFTPAPVTSTVNTSLNEETPVSVQLNVYPNPFSEALSISMNGPTTAYNSASLYTYVISDLLGRTVSSGSFERGNAFSQEIKLPAGMSKGLYVFTLSNAKGKTLAVKKIVRE